MKKLLITLTFKIVFVTILYSQNQPETILVDSFYENKLERLITSKIIEVDSVGTAELIKRVKNWGGTSFVNLKEVLVSETDDQLVFNYISKDFYIKTFITNVNYSWYVRLVAQFKDGKVRLLFYDDGNCFVPGSYANGVSTPATPARSSHLSNYFRKNNNTAATKASVPGIINFKKSVENTANSIQNAIITPTIQKEEKKGDW